MKLLTTAVTGLALSLMVSTAFASTSNERIAERLKPRGSVCVEGQDCSGVKVAAAVNAAPSASAARSGEDIFNSACTNCHSTGAAGAPVVGKADQWAARIAKGNETLYTHAINGFNAMPPKGLCGTCSDDEIKETVDYMVSKSQ